MLVVCGETYADRLWCIWELYTLFAVSGGSGMKLTGAARQNSAVLSNIIVRDTTRGNGPTAQHRLSSFDLGNSKCYDPNEEAKLHRAIAAAPGGANRFNQVRGSLLIMCW